jgi:hypothetical protein
MKPWHSILAVVLLPILYFLSLGPVVRYQYLSGPLFRPSKSVETFYAPMKWAWYHSTTIQAVESWYVNLWIPEIVPQEIKWQN